MRNRWFLPEVPDVVGMLTRQWSITRDAAHAFVAWARGDQTRAEEVRRLEHEADDAKRELWRSLRTAFVTPFDAEDLFAMSAELDEVLNAMKDAVREAEACGLTPDAPLLAMADHLHDGIEILGEALALLPGGADGALAAADRVVKQQRAVEHVYRDSVPELVRDVDVRDAVMRRELYVHVVRASERMRAVAERIWYSVVKEG